MFTACYIKRTVIFFQMLGHVETRAVWFGGVREVREVYKTVLL
jgi:hypothetical protein